MDCTLGIVCISATTDLAPTNDMEDPLIDDGTASLAQGPRTILVGVDDSSASFRALSYAAGLAQRNEAMLVFVHVCCPSPVASIAVDITGDALDGRDSEGMRFAELARTTALEQGVGVKFALRDGDPAHEIAGVADDVHADVIVVERSHSRIHRLVHSVPNRLERRGAWPVTVVP